MSLHRFWLIPILHCLLAFAIDSSVASAEQSPELFDASIAPILSAKCVSCHQPGNSKGGLDITTREGMLRGGDSGPAIVPGKPDESPIYARTIPHDGEAPEMPEKGTPLSESESEALRTWIDAGANWPANRVLREQSKADASFWSLQTVNDVEPPHCPDAPQGWSYHPIDRFVWEKLQERGLQPNPTTDPRTFIRRATVDLWGLPPSPDEVAQFETDCAAARQHPDDLLPDAAVERLIDRLLQSPHYGERWGRHWLDIAHYADTHGFERDQIRPNAWRYRDWVIEALNDDLRYDQFLQKQIAGDVISPDDPKSVIATGFLAAGPWDFVGHVETQSDVLKRAARAGDLDDMVTQVMTATMGLTVNCARCHDHKLDPISQEDYYRLTSIFAGVKRSERDVSPAETQDLSRRKKELTEQLSKLRQQIAELSGDGWSLADIVGGGDGHGSGKPNQGIDLRDGKSNSEKLGYLRDVPVNQLVAVITNKTNQHPSPAAKYVFIPDGKGSVPIDENRSVQGLPPTSGVAWDLIRNGPINAQASTKLNDIDYASPGHSILGLHANSGITFDLSALQKDETALGFILTGVVGFGSGSGGAGTHADFSIFVDQSLAFQRLKLGKADSEQFGIPLPLGTQTLTLVATDGGDGIGHDLLFLGDATIRPIRSETEQTQAVKDRLAQWTMESSQIEKTIAELPAPAKVFAVNSETPPEVRVLRRGNPEDPLQSVSPGVLQCVSHTKSYSLNPSLSEGERRRTLAEWIIHPDNPLTRRVLVNRLWHHHFGQGIVNTPSDFGYGGDRPSHPELLDWLANEVLRSHWSLKQLHKTIMMSATYRQSSTIVPERAKIDSGNRFLWRQNARRLDAESLRDAVLFVAGNLNLEMGGPGYRDFKYTEAYAPIYEYVTPNHPELWKRSVYRFVVRTTPHQFMATLDCPDPANLTPSRVTTTTAMQALALSNNEFMLQQAEHLAARAKTVNAAFQLVFQRDPTQAELQAAQSLADKQGLFAVCRALLNANEFVTID
jgi:hypothetical protein